MHRGHIKLFRKMKESPWFGDSQFVHVWVYLLLSVNWTAKKWQAGNTLIDVFPGQIVTSRKKISEETGISESKIQRILSCFESEQQIEQQNKSKYRVITITNWSKHQACEQQIEQQTNSKRTATEQQLNTTKEGKELKEGKEEERGPAQKSIFIESLKKLTSDCIGPMAITPTLLSRFQKWEREGRELTTLEDCFLAVSSWPYPKRVDLLIKKVENPFIIPQPEEMDLDEMDRMVGRK